MKRHATAVWNGSGKEGSGNLTTQSEILSSVGYTWKSRFQDGTGTNPEELVAAAHSGCFSMKLSFVLGEAGYTPDSIETTCTITIEDGTINSSHLVVTAKVPGMSNDEFQSAVDNAKKNCPISKLLDTAITAEATLA